MTLYKEAEAYLNQVCGQVRWKKAHGCIRQELTAHIEDQAAQYRKEGLEEAEAWAKAVAAMGDPVETGALLDASYRPAPPIAASGAGGGGGIGPRPAARNRPG